MTTDKKRQLEILSALKYLKERVATLTECVEEDIRDGLNTSETDLQIDLATGFDHFLHKIGYDYDQRRW